MAFLSDIEIYLPAVIAASILIAAVVAWWCVRVPRLALGLLAISLVAGQLVRVPVFGQVGGLLGSDIAVLLVLVAAVVRMRTMQIQHLQWALLAVPFLLWGGWTLFVQPAPYSNSQLAVAMAYLLRLAAILLLAPALMVIWREKVDRRFVKKLSLISVGALLLAGYAQILVFPSLKDVPFLGSSAGWDPHIGRMVSTWLDPNFFGVVLAICIPLIVIRPRFSWKIVFAALVVVSALMLTKSRSSVMALIVAGMFYSPVFLVRSTAAPARRFHQQVRVGASAAFAMMALALFLALPGTRLEGLLHGDETVALRLEALRSVWDRLIEPHALVGVGYNAYQFAAQGTGVISDTSLHSRAGADSSIATLWVTSGVFGVALFFLPWLYACGRFLKQWINEHDYGSLSALMAISIVVIHAQAVNSMLYAHLLIALVIICAYFYDSQRARLVS